MEYWLKFEKFLFIKYCWNDEKLNSGQATAIINVEKMRETAMTTVIAKPT